MSNKDTLLEINQVTLKRILSLLTEAGRSVYATDYEGMALSRAYELCEEQIKINAGIKEI